MWSCIAPGMLQTCDGTALAKLPVCKLDDGPSHVHFPSTPYWIRENINGTNRHKHMGSTLEGQSVTFPKMLQW